MGARKSSKRKKPSDKAAQSQGPGSGGKRVARPTKKPVFRFVLSFAILMGLFEVICLLPLVKDRAFPAYLRANAWMSGSIIGMFEDSMQVVGQRLASPRGALVIERGCDAVAPSALFLSGVLAFPAPFFAKVPGMLLGTFCLMALNLVRIISLFYVQIYYPRAFHIMHVDVWQSLFVFLAILGWVLWAVWAVKRMEARAATPAAA